MDAHGQQMDFTNVLMAAHGQQVDFINAARAEVQELVHSTRSLSCDMNSFKWLFIVISP